MKKRDILWASLALLALWELLALAVHQPILPPPPEVAAAFWRDLGRGLPLHFLASLGRVTAGIAVSVLLGVPAGLALGMSRRLHRLLGPLVYILYPIPKVVLVPVVFLVLGIGDLAKVAMIFIILFFQVLVLVRDQAAAIPPALVASVRSLGAGRRALFRYVYFPACVPAILTSLRQSVGTAVAVLYIAELFATKWGLGYYIYFQGSTLMDYPAMYAGVVAMSLLGLGLYFGIDLLERRLCPWAR
ncbi:MAG TPA: ABC transporter permease [Rectinemataceae bacterium]|nr:ABC transporter permease [Rectinemataceae bacterium]